jgi:hypothetical protein
MASAMEHAKSRSSNIAGNGSTIIKTIPMMPSGTMKSPLRFFRVSGKASTLTASY